MVSLGFGPRLLPTQEDKVANIFWQIYGTVDAYMRLYEIDKVVNPLLFGLKVHPKFYVLLLKPFCFSPLSSLANPLSILQVVENFPAFV